MNEIKHDDEWLNDELQGIKNISTEDAIQLAREYLEHMTRVRVTADELPRDMQDVIGFEMGIHPTGVYNLDEYEDHSVWRRLSSEGGWVICDAPDGWQPILRSGGGV